MERKPLPVYPGGEADLTLSSRPHRVYPGGERDLTLYRRKAGRGVERKRLPDPTGFIPVVREI